VANTTYDVVIVGAGIVGAACADEFARRGLRVAVVDRDVQHRTIGSFDVAGQHVEKRWCDPSFPTTGEATCKGLPAITPNISYAFRWDGLDAYDRTIQAA